MFDEKILPDSRYYVDKYLNRNLDLTYHAICPTCEKYLKMYNKEDLDATNCTVHCDQCDVDINLKKISNEHFFVMIDPSPMISDLVAANEAHYNYVTGKNYKYDENIISDVYDSNGYRNFVNSLEHEGDYLTGVFNMDGAVKFKGSTRSLHPIQININELRIQERIKNNILCGLWFGNSKPNLQCYLTAFTNMMNNLSTTGLNVQFSTGHKNLKLYMLVSVVDSIARAPMQSKKQFNAEYGCEWCEHHGVFREGSMRYVNTPIEPRIRTMAQTKLYLEEYMRTQLPVKGFVGVSPLINLKKFDLITGFVPDPMHFCWAGIAGQFLDYHLEGLTKDEIAFLDESILKFKVPHQLCRLTKAVSKKAQWNCREKENWTLFYSIPLLKQFITYQKIKHWSLFVNSLYIVQQQQVTVHELEKVRQDLKQFVQQTQELYGEKAMTYNVHLLLHLVDSILDWGPPIVRSTYGFESGNGRLLRYMHSPKGIHEQIVRFINLEICVALLEQRIGADIEESVKDYCDSLYFRRTKKFVRALKVTYFGKPKPPSDNDVLMYNLDVNTVVYKRMVKDHCLYLSNVKENARSSKSFVILKNSMFMRIKRFIHFKENQSKDITVCNKLNTRRSTYYPKMFEVTSEDEEEIQCFTEDIMRVCVFMDTETNQYIIPVCNLYYY